MNILKLAAWAGAALIMVGVFAMASAVVSGGGRAGQETRTAGVVRVIDGDTFEIEGGARIRVRNFDTPERRRYDCAAEKAAAEAATQAARRLLSRRMVRLAVTGEDRYGRLISDVAILARGPGGDRDFVDAMVRQGHGARWDYGNEPQPDWCPSRPWWRALLGL